MNSMFGPEIVCKPPVSSGVVLSVLCQHTNSHGHISPNCLETDLLLDSCDRLKEIADSIASLYKLVMKIMGIEATIKVSFSYRPSEDSHNLDSCEIIACGVIRSDKDLPDSILDDARQVVDYFAYMLDRTPLLGDSNIPAELPKKLGDNKELNEKLTSCLEQPYPKSSLPIYHKIDDNIRSIEKIITKKDVIGNDDGTVTGLLVAFDVKAGDYWIKLGNLKSQIIFSPNSYIGKKVLRLLETRRLVYKTNCEVDCSIKTEKIAGKEKIKYRMKDITVLPDVDSDSGRKKYENLQIPFSDMDGDESNE